MTECRVLKDFLNGLILIAQCYNEDMLGQLKNNLILGIVLGFSFFIISPKLCFSANEFTTAYYIIYKIAENGQASVIQNISLTNHTTNIYVTEYNLNIPSIEIFEVKGNDNLGPLKIDLNKTDHQTNIHLYFNEKVVGKNKSLNFKLEYKTNNIAQKKGQIWEVYIPSLEDATSITSYQVELDVPDFFGKPSFSFPDLKDKTKLIWDKLALEKGIVVFFGKKQVFSFDLTFNLENDSLVPVRYKIALPPDTFYQKVFYSKISPPPTNIIADDDGNWLGFYTLLPKQNLRISAQGKAVIYNYPFQTEDDLSRNLDKYTKEDKYWESENEEIKVLAKKLETPQNIYHFVINHLNYNYDRISETPERMGALNAYKSPNKAICMEFTDLFIALARAAGIPAREVQGYAYTSDPLLRPITIEGDILHSWPEYFDQQKKMWIAIDPTWGKTTGGVDYFSNFDFNHFAFVIHGLSSEKPYPAGAYKSSLQKNKKDININFSNEQLDQETKPVELILDLPKKIIGEKGFNGKVIINNPNGKALYDIIVDISSSTFLPDSPKIHLYQIPPFANKSISVRFNLDEKNEKWAFLSNFTIKKEKIVIITTGAGQTKEIEILPFYSIYFLFIGLGLIFLLFLLLIWKIKKNY